MKLNIIQLKLKEQRNKIDKIDKDIIKFLNQRAEIVRKIAKIKLQNDIPLQNIKREKQILEKTNFVRNKVFVKNIFKKIIHESKLLQKELK